MGVLAIGTVVDAAGEADGSGAVESGRTMTVSTLCCDLEGERTDHRVDGVMCASDMLFK